MFTEIWELLLYNPILNLLMLFYNYLGSNMGIAIITLTLLIKILTYPLNKSSLLIAKKQKELQPEIQKLKDKYKDKQIFAQKQMELFKENGINPAAGCFPPIIQIVVFITLFNVFKNLLAENIDIEAINNALYSSSLIIESTEKFSTTFLYLNLGQPDPIYLLPILAAASQFVMSKYMSATTKPLEKPVESTPDKKDDIMYNVQQQMTYTMPIITLIIGLTFASGLVLYMLISSLFSIAQYMYLNKYRN